MYEMDLIGHTDTVNELLARYGVKFGIYKNNTFKEQLFPFDSIPMSGHRFTVKSIPQSNDRQQIQKLDYNIFPDSSLATGFSKGTDSFGNYCVYGECDSLHEYFGIHVQGETKTGMCAWVEVYSQGRWYSLDPTNNLVVDADHLIISILQKYHKSALMNCIKTSFCQWQQD